MIFVNSLQALYKIKFVKLLGEGSLTHVIGSFGEIQAELAGRIRHPLAAATDCAEPGEAQTVPTRFESMVREYGSRLAIRSTDFTWTYSDLNNAANNIAHRLLQDLGADAEPVCLLLENDAPAVAAMLAVLKAGKFYVPLDPQFPPSALMDIVADSASRLVITNHANLVLARTVIPSDTLLLNLDTQMLSQPAGDPQVTQDPDALACMIYTSGSTGRPKGVYTNHRNLVRIAMQTSSAFGMSPEDRVANVRSMSFNGALKDIYASMLSGASLWPFDTKRRGFQQMARWLREEQITLWLGVATAFRHMALAVQQGEPPATLRLILTGGEPLRADDVDLFRRTFSPNTMLVIGYAASETLTVCQFWVGHTEEPPQTTHFPAGFPVDHMEIRIVDAEGRECGPNEIGEIQVRSQYLACGYWNNQELTSQKFLPDPDGGERRIYCTGDLGYLDHEGCLYFLGRDDGQVKIRGHRVELAEIEQLLGGHPSIRETVVLARPNSAGQSRLVAYVTGRLGANPDTTELRHFLRERLPEYKVPSAFVLLERFPTTEHGKVNRRALPHPGHARPPLGTEYLPPRTPIETQLAQIWADRLDLDEVGVRDAFLELGGDSIIAAQIIAQIQTDFGLEMSPADLFAAATIEDMSVALLTLLVAEHESSDRA